ncbi:Alpha/Beta hydrolase protein [Sphaerosporella brunnea]|uniref:Alpha/Beta hydrolase protein n=1 Tax=Sphaerosporella brunnea TaxID=1250544 RepID=A0A5J5F3M9_9PEZI|nr:Alpha/Beta hydrolase protein [Sphaerosporella brunnea]
MHHRPPSTALNLFIPSLHDSTPLETLLLVPSPVPTTSRKAAVIAHPYGPLGGSLNDAVVQRLAAILLRRGYIVVLFNFRGVGHSRGHTSWTGSAERKDYAAVAAWALAFLVSLAGSSGEGEQQQQEEAHLLAAGYSYGALIAAASSVHAQYLLETLRSPPTPAYATALAAGIKSARCWGDVHSVAAARTSYSGVRSPQLPPPPPAEAQLQELRRWEEVAVRLSYLLVSPPLPPVSSLLLLGGGGRSVLDPVSAAEAGAGAAKKVFVAWGDDDVFTGVRKYRRWAEKMRSCEFVFEGVEVAGATHFWGEKALGVVEERLGAWLEGEG